MTTEDEGVSSPVLYILGKGHHTIHDVPKHRTIRIRWEEVSWLTI
jgi:hypothetical protein